jgi:hypothetical protein
VGTSLLSFPKAQQEIGCQVPHYFNRCPEIQVFQVFSESVNKREKPINDNYSNFEQILHYNIKYKGYSICNYPTILPFHIYFI